MKYGFVKKVMAASLAAAMSLTLSPAFAMVDLPEGKIDSKKVLKYENYQNATGTDIVTESDGNKADSLANLKWHRSIPLSVDSTISSDIVLSFSVKPKTVGVNSTFFLRRSGAYMDAGLLFTTDGKIIAGAGNLDKRTYGADQHPEEIGTWEADKWYNIDLVASDYDKNDYTQTVNLYINGEFKKTLKYDWVKELDQETIEKNYKVVGAELCFYYGANYGENGATEDLKGTDIFVDNIKAQYIHYQGEDNKFYAQVDSSKAMTDGVVTVEYTETPALNVGDNTVKLYSPTGEEIAITSSVLNGRFATYTFDQNTLSEYGEYTLVLASQKSVTGKSLGNEAVVFENREADITDDEVLYTSKWDFNNYTSGQVKEHRDVQKTSHGLDETTVTNFPLAYYDMAGYEGESTFMNIPSTLEEGAGKNGSGDNAMHLKYNYNELNNRNGSSKRYTSQAKANCGFSYDLNSNADNEYITSVDVKFNSFGSASPRFKLKADVNEENLALFVVDKYGHLVCSGNNHTLGNNAAQLAVSYYWAGVLKDDGTFIDKPSDVAKENYDNWKDYYSINKLETGKWYNIKVGLDLKNKLVNYYLDGVKIYSFVNPNIRDTTSYNCFGMDFYADQDKQNTKNTDMYVDNMNFGYRNAEDVIVSTNTIEEEMVKAKGNDGWTYTNKAVDIAAEADIKKEVGNSGYILTADVDIDQLNNQIAIYVYPSTHSDCGIIALDLIDDKGTVYVEPAATNFTGSLNTEKTKYCCGGGDQIYYINNAFKVGKNKITIFFDKDRKNAKVFVNGYTNKKTIDLHNVQGVTHSTTSMFDHDKNGTISTEELTAGRIGVRILGGSDYTGKKIKVGNVKLSKLNKYTEKKILENIRVIGKGEEEFTLFNTDNFVNGFELNYRWNVTSDTEVKLTKKDGETSMEVPVTVTVNSEKANQAVVTLDGNKKALPDGAYTLTVDGKDYNFNINTGKKLEITEALDITTSGENATATAKLCAFNDNTPVMVMIAEYNSNGTLKNVKYESKTLSAGEEYNANVSITGVTTGNPVRGYIWSDFSTLFPYASAEK